MKRLLLIIIGCMMNMVCLYSQILPDLTEVELLKGKVKKVTTTSYHSDGKDTKVISEHDSLGRINSKINYYVKKNPQKEYFSYDSIGNVVSHIYEDNNGVQQYNYEYIYDAQGRIISQRELRDGKFFRSYDSIIYNDDNLPVQYRESSKQFFIKYADSNNEKIKYIEEKQNTGITNTTEEIRLYNDLGFLIKKKRETTDYYLREVPKTDLHIPWDKQFNQFKHSEEYDYVNYKYDKQGNWTEHKRYLNRDEKGSYFHVKIKRKIEYY